MVKSKRSRGFVYTDWNPTPARVKKINKILTDAEVRYFIGTKEKGKGGEYHIQGYIIFKHSKTLSAAKKLMAGPKCWLKIPRGTQWECVKYCFEEAGHEILLEINPDNRPKETDSADSTNQWEVITEMIKAGKGEYEIMVEFPGTYVRASVGIAKMIFNYDQNKINKWREVKVTYLYGATGVGKTRSVLDTDKSVYRITDYKNPFDNYRGEEIIIFEEFRDSLPIEQMLIYLDGYVCQLPARYANRVSRWTEIWIISNIDIYDQYHHEDEMTKLALLRRIDDVVLME